MIFDQFFYADDEVQAREFYEGFVAKWEKDCPSAVKCLNKSIDSCLTFMRFPKEEWLNLRTTNVIERLNKEFNVGQNRWKSYQARQPVIVY